MTYSGGTDRAANNPSRYYYMRAKYGPPVMEGLERASKNTPTTQSQLILNALTFDVEKGFDLEN